MSPKNQLSHESLTNRDGFILDSDHNCHMLWKQHEFSRWWRCFEGLFTHPLSRTFINSVVDDLEFHHRLASPTRFFKKKNFNTNLANLSHFFGSGRIDLSKKEIVNGAHPLFSVGLASYALEVFHQTRYKFRWNEPTPRVVQLLLENNTQLPPPRPIRSFPWSDKIEPTLESNMIPFSNQLISKESGHIEIDGERYMLLPASLLERFVSSCLPHAPDMSQNNWIECPSLWSSSECSILALIITSIGELFSLSERSVYITGPESWDAYFRVYLLDQGWGHVTLVSYDVQSYDTILQIPRSPLAPFSIGLITSIWERAHGRKFKLIIGQEDELLQVSISSLLEYKVQV